MSAMRFSKSTPDSRAPSTSSLAPKTPSNRENFSDRSWNTRWSAAFFCLSEEVDHHHIVLLPVAMAAADALLDALRVPWQVVIHHKGAELEVDTFRAGLRGDHDLTLLAEVLHECRPH